MKKLYTLIAVATVAFGATATPSLVNKLSVSSDFTSINVQAAAPAVDFAPAKAAAVVPTGDWNVIGEGMVAEGFLEDINSEITADPGMTWAVTIEQSATDAAWYRTVVYNENSPIVDIMGEADTDYFYFNVADPEKVYSTEFLIGGGTYAVYQQVEESGLFGMLANPATLEANPKYGKLENGLITFPKGAFWVLDEVNRKFLRIDNDGGFKIALPGTEIPSMWVDLGTATWNDGIMSPYMDITAPQAVATEVMVQVSADNDMVFRLVQPWRALNSQKNFVVDMSYVAANGEVLGQVQEQSTGVIDEEMGLVELMSRSINYANGIEGFEADAATRKEYNISWTAETRTITFPSNSVFFYFPATDPEHLYTMGEWSVVSTISVPEQAGIQGVVVEDNFNAAREYFNLQGVRVANPSNGLYIVRQGNKVQKVFVR